MDEYHCKQEGCSKYSLFRHGIGYCRDCLVAHPESVKLLWDFVLDLSEKLDETNRDPYY